MTRYGESPFNSSCETYEDAPNCPACSIVDRRNVPFIASWPAKISAGRTYDAPVIALDIARTAVSVAGADSTAKTDDRRRRSNAVRDRPKERPAAQIYVLAKR